ncbi:MAG: hypothetical protein COA58_14040 [Bacteroidetes bacterium]|nr:MAG: hypothetical protein COA58_14040 [Bacteroidota bacterium]
MKKYVIILITFLFTLTVYAQNNEPVLKKLRLIGSSGSLGISYDRYQTMSLNQLSQLAKDPEMMKHNLDGLTEEANASTAGVSLFINLRFNPLQKRTGSYNRNQELRLGLGLNSSKEAMVSYKNKDLDTSLVFCNIHSEITTEVAYVFKRFIGKRIFVYGGIGANSSISINNEMMIITGKYFAPGEHPSTQISSNTISFEAKPILHSRLFIPWGVHIQATDNFSIGLDFRKGKGLQYTLGEKANVMANTGAILIGTSFTLK